MIVQTDSNVIFDLIKLFSNLTLLHIFIAITIFIAFIWITGRVLKSIIKRIRWIPPNIRNGFVILLNLIQLYIATLGSFTILGANQQFLIGFSALVAAIIGFASISVASNIVGGIYLIIARPFKAGDLIKAQGIEGIVEEIGLNYTTIVRLDRNIVTIPNSIMLKASLLNYNTITPPELDLVDKGHDDRNTSFSYLMWGIYPDPPHIRYINMIQIEFSFTTPPLTLEKVKTRLDDVCDQFTSVFGFKPTYYFGKHDFRQNVFFQITSDDAYTIFNSWPFFMEAIVEHVYSELQLEGSA